MRVLIVGAGPSGLMMALCLKEQGIAATIIDKKDTTTEFSKALGMQARTLEVFQDLNLAQALIESGSMMPKIAFYKGKKLLGNADFSWLDTSFPFILGIPQSSTEAILEKALAAKGVTVRWNTSLEQLEQMEERVFVTLNKEGHVVSELFDYVIGCDGIHSKVRKSLNIPFKGMKDPENFAIADLEMEGPIAKDYIVAMIAEDNSGLVLFFPITQGRTRIVVNNCTLDPQDKPSLEYFQKIVSQRTKQPIQLKHLNWSSIFNVQYRKAACFSQGRCFIVGDAAHVHSPIGGQGMNTGLQDAYNLAWKLAFVINNKAYAHLLDTYNEERHLNAKKLLMMTKIMTIVGTAKSAILKVLRPHILKFVLNHQMFSRFMTKKLSQLSTHYRSSSLSKENTRSKGQLRAGDRLCDCEVTVGHNNLKLLEWIRGSHMGIVVFTRHLKPIENQLRQLDFLMNAKYPHLHIVVITLQNGICELQDFTGKIGSCALESFERYAKTFPKLYVIRPDKYISYIQEPINLKALENTLDEYLTH